MFDEGYWFAFISSHSPDLPLPRGPSPELEFIASRNSLASWSLRMGDQAQR